MSIAIKELGDNYQNESAHAGQVTRFALAIWDSASPVFDLKPSERRLMRAAALLHDIGYSRYPNDHQAGSRKIILKNGIAGFTETQCRIIAGAVLLHRRKFGPELDLPFFADPAVREPAMRIGAILRIADGLDHGHCQNASIISVQPEGDRMLCTVSTPGYEGNLLRARANGDLWLRVFKVPFVIQEAPANGTLPKFSGIVSPRDNLPDALRKLLFLHFRIFTEQFDGMIAGQSEEPLHDARIAIRRYRSLLHMFSLFLPAHARLVDRQIALLCRKLSDFRDSDVWLAFLAKLKISASFRSDPEFGEFFNAEMQLYSQQHTAFTALLNSKGYSSTTKAMIRLPRVELSRVNRSIADLPVAQFAGLRLSAAFYDILSRPGISRKTDPETAHRLRKKCRRLRYWAEFFTPVAGAPCRHIAVIMKELADTLGDLHDTDCFIARVKQKDSPAAGRIVALLDRNRHRQHAAFKLAWEKLRSPETVAAAAALAVSSKKIPRITMVRHTTAVDGPDDRKRPLTAHGVDEAKRIGRVFRLLGGPPAFIVSSPMARAHSTASFIAEAFLPQPKVTRLNGLLPDAQVGDTIQRLASANGSCLCVGHQPQLGLLAGALLADTGKVPPELGKGSACRIAFPEGKIEAGKGVLEWSFTQGKMKRLEKRLNEKGESDKVTG